MRASACDRDDGIQVQYQIEKKCQKDQEYIQRDPNNRNALRPAKTKYNTHRERRDEIRNISPIHNRGRGQVAYESNV